VPMLASRSILPLFSAAAAATAAAAAFAFSSSAAASSANGSLNTVAPEQNVTVLHENTPPAHGAERIRGVL
jgi:ABC-type glycerol-3-phosphate transport system substrate-binding protein